MLAPAPRGDREAAGTNCIKLYTRPETEQAGTTEFRAGFPSLVIDILHPGDIRDTSNWRTLGL